jgi:hypothetical protein
MRIADDSSARQKYFLKTSFMSTNREGWVNRQKEKGWKLVADTDFTGLERTTKSYCFWLLVVSCWKKTAARQ